MYDGRMDPVISYRKNITPFYFEEGCWIEESWNRPEDTACSIALARVPVGGRTRWHRLRDVTERYVILSGAGLVEVGEEPATPVGEGDVVIIPPEVRQRITNTGQVELEFYAVCTPRFTPECYRDIDDELDIR